MFQRHTMPIQQYLQGLYRDRDNVEWNFGNAKSLHFIEREISRVQQRIKAGELYEPLF